MDKKIESLAPTLTKALKKFYADPENQKKYEIWCKEREKAAKEK